MATNFNILTFSGGGIRGVISTSLLDKLYKTSPNLLTNTSLLGGTSTGAIIAAALANGLTPQAVKSLYSFEDVKYIFDSPRSSLLRPKYDSSHLLEVLKKTFPTSLTMGELKKPIIIPTFSLGSSSESWKAILYTNLAKSPTANAKVIDVLMASCAAPIYFPSYQSQVDGGIIGYDPSLLCLLSSLAIPGNSFPKIRILSIGTGTSSDPVSITEDTTTWGATQWAVNATNLSYPLLNLSITSNAMLSYLVTTSLLRTQYQKLDVKFNGNVPLDDYTKISYLNSLADNQDITSTSSWVNTNWI